MQLKFGQKIIDYIRFNLFGFNKNKKYKKKVIIENYTNANFPIALSQNEQNFLIKNAQRMKKYLEFGSGGSTFLLLTETQIQKIVSVESDNNWIQYLRNWNLISENEGNRLKFFYANIGATGAYGVPIEENKRYLFPNYSSDIFKNNENYDCIFIDGRFRVACALQSILNSGKNTQILMHDFNNREKYHCILEFLEIKDTMDTMALFQIKNNYNKSKLIQMYEKYKFIYD